MRYKWSDKLREAIEGHLKRTRENPNKIEMHPAIIEELCEEYNLGMKMEIDPINLRFMGVEIEEALPHYGFRLIS